MTAAPARLSALSNPRQASRNAGLFAEPPAGDDAPIGSGGGVEAARPSLFGTVTGLIRRHRMAVSAAIAPADMPPVARVEPARVEPAVAETRSDNSRVSVRPVAGEEMGIEIPTFLRRQTS